ncbi:hypothetical protein, partial [Streptomyces sp. NP-1717]|uniref:hypothetical protein n=1 Tax=Streptomyces sp. NP-1717 TaxID=2704470 RepID=UPI001F5DCB7D
DALIAAAVRIFLITAGSLSQEMQVVRPAQPNALGLVPLLHSFGPRAAGGLIECLMSRWGELR